MKKFLFTALISNDLGLFTRSLPIACELRDRGHQVTFCNPAKAPSKVISDAGFNNLPIKWNLCNFLAGDFGLFKLSTLYELFRSGHLKRDLGILVSRLKSARSSSTAEYWNVDQAASVGGMGNENYVKAEVNAWMELIREYNPDAVVDFANIGACIAARAIQKPLITVIQADNKVLAELQLKPIRKAAELFVGEITLVVGMPETDPLPDTANVTYIGPVLWQRPGERLPDWFADLSMTKPVIWLYPGNPQYIRGHGTAFDSRVVTHACIKALHDEPIQVVLSTGHHPLPKDVNPLPSNFRHVSFVPGLAMAERSDLMIHHGGYGSCQTGLFTGTPALVIPTYSERESNARRVAAVGAGDFVLPTADVSGRKKHVDAAEVRDKVNRILSDSSFKENAKRISEKLRTYGGAPYAAGLIEDSV